MAKTKHEFRSAFGIYTTTRSLGEGGSGTVFEAQDEKGIKVAVKILDPGKANREKLKRFRNEILFGSVPRHENILRVLDHGVATVNGKETLFYVMPLYAQTLRDLLAKGMGTADPLRLFATLLDGVEAAHLLGVVHRDIKPENVLYDAQRQALVIGDFGVAHFEQEELYTLVETKPGTRLANFLYAAPEQRVRGQVVDHRADIYSLGLILNEFFTGEVPQGTGYRTIASRQAGLAYLDTIVDAMIRQDPTQRLHSIDAVKQRLIAEHADFVARQKLDQLSRQVVPETEVDDPIVRDPIRIVDVEVNSSGLSLKLNQQPSPEWIRLYQNMSGVSFYLGQDFRRFPIRNGRIELQSHDERYYQDLINQSKKGIEATNREYAIYAREQHAQRLREQRQRLEAAAEAERRRLELRRKLTF